MHSIIICGQVFWSHRSSSCTWNLPAIYLRLLCIMSQPTCFRKFLKSLWKSFFLYRLDLTKSVSVSDQLTRAGINKTDRDSVIAFVNGLWQTVYGAPHDGSVESPLWLLLSLGYRWPVPLHPATTGSWPGWLRVDCWEIDARVEIKWVGVIRSWRYSASRESIGFLDKCIQFHQAHSRYSGA
jgi:hypothetical protein